MFYTLANLAVFTGYTERSLRAYLKSGLLHGEKVNGKWRFTVEDYGAFLRNPAIRAAMLAKQNAQVLDYLADTKKNTEQSLVILDLQPEKCSRMTDFLCGAINSEPAFSDVKLNFQNHDGNARLVLSGDANNVRTLLQRFYETETDG